MNPAQAVYLILAMHVRRLWPFPLPEDPFDASEWFDIIGDDWDEHLR